MISRETAMTMRPLEVLGLGSLIFMPLQHLVIRIEVFKLLVHDVKIVENDYYCLL